MPQRTPAVLGSILFALTFGGVLAFQATVDKIVYANAPVQITDAVMITTIAVEGKPIECGLFVKPPVVVEPVTPFQAGPNWLQTMTISLINRTNKTIASGQITLAFLDAGDCRHTPCPAGHIQLGQIPAIAAHDGRTGKPLPNPGTQPLDLKPDQVLAVHVGTCWNDILDESGLEKRMPVTAVSKVRIDIGLSFSRTGCDGAEEVSTPYPTRSTAADSRTSRQLLSRKEESSLAAWIRPVGAQGSVSGLRSRAGDEAVAVALEAE